MPLNCCRSIITDFWIAQKWIIFSSLEYVLKVNDQFLWNCCLLIHQSNWDVWAVKALHWSLFATESISRSWYAVVCDISDTPSIIGPQHCHGQKTTQIMSRNTWEFNSSTKNLNPQAWHINVGKMKSYVYKSRRNRLLWNLRSSFISP